MVVDIILAVLIGVGVWMGYKKGLLIELILLLAFIIALVSAFKLLQTTISFLKEYISSGSLLVLISFISVFTIVFVLIFLLGKLLKKTIDYTIFGALDSFIGALIGGLKAAFAISMLLWLIHNAGLNKYYQDYLRDTYLYSYLVDFGPEFIHWVSHVIPFKDIFPSIKKLLN